MSKTNFFLTIIINFTHLIKVPVTSNFIFTSGSSDLKWEITRQVLVPTLREAVLSHCFYFVCAGQQEARRIKAAEEEVEVWTSTVPSAAGSSGTPPSSPDTSTTAWIETSNRTRRQRLPI